MQGTRSELVSRKRNSEMAGGAPGGGPGGRVTRDRKFLRTGRAAGRGRGSPSHQHRSKTLKAPNQLKLLLQIRKRRTEGRINLRSLHGEILSSVLVRPRFLQAKPTNSRGSLAWPTPGEGGRSLPQTSYTRM